MDKNPLHILRPTPPAPRDGFKNLKRALFGATVLAVLVVGGAALWLDSAPAGARAGVFEIAPGTPALRIVRDLREQGFIRSSTWFMGWVTLRSAAGKFKSGAYDVPEDMGAMRLLSLLLSGKTRRAKVVVPEGFAVWQVAERLQASNVCLAEDFEILASSVSAEGTLFPDTYYLEEHMPPAAVLRVMQGRFKEAWASVLAEAGCVFQEPLALMKLRTLENNDEYVNIRDKGLTTKWKIVTMASLVEREARKDEERPLIAAVYYNRLKKRMYLEADPTVQYALGYWKDRLLYRDLDVQSPYNTYRRFGLPPGPICSPGRAALLAALCPASVPHLYFVADQTGGHVFSETFQKHSENVGVRNRVRRELRRQQKSKTAR